MNSLALSTCRICLHSQDNLLQLSEHHILCEKLSQKTQLELNYGGNLPSAICNECLKELDTTVRFLEKCVKSNELLCKYYQNGKEEAEDNNSDDSNIEPIVKNLCLECGSREHWEHWIPPSIHKCPHCFKVFSRKFNYILHLKRHSGHREWKCEKCGAGQYTQWHARRHCLPRQRLACTFGGCYKKFTTRTNLNTHMRSHTGERPYKCKECEKCFTSGNSLREHGRIHTGIKKYMCSICGERFTTNKLKAHVASAHMRSPRPASLSATRGVHTCAHCPAKYAHTQSLNKHMKKHHPKVTKT